MTEIKKHGSATIYYKEGKVHREDGPAIIYENGTKKWYVNDLRHREGSPAIEWADGDRMWFDHDKLHRVNGPAIERKDGNHSWYLNGVEYSYEDFVKEIKAMKKR